MCGGKYKGVMNGAMPGRAVHLVKYPDMLPYNTDGTHLNDAGHEQLFNQVVKAGVVKMQ